VGKTNELPLGVNRFFRDPFETESPLANLSFFEEKGEALTDEIDADAEERRIEEVAEFDRFLSDDEKKVELTISEFAERLLSINRKPFSLERRDYLRDVYDINETYPDASRNVVIMSGRQVEKSTTLCGKSITLAAINPAFFTLFVQPRFDQVKVFSQQRFQPMAEDSEVLQRVWLSNKNLWQVGAREFLNRSYFNFRSCYYSADPIRGISSHNLMIDELQDIISDNIPIMEECQSHFLSEEPEKCFRMYTGTPKTTSNTLNLHWKETCQFEWMVRCESCHHYNFLDDKVIGKHHYICTKCGRQIYPQIHGEWIAQRPSLMDTRWGFRIPQIMVPFMSHAQILDKLNDPAMPQRYFFNEVLGLPYDEGELVLTADDIRAACEERGSETPDTIQKWNIHLCAGVDHGTGGYSPVDPLTGMTKIGQRKGRQPSYTVIAIGGFCGDGRFRIFKIIKFVGEMANLAKQPGIIDKIIREWHVAWVMSDWGFGASTNEHLVTTHNWVRIEDGYNPLMMEIQYVRSKVLASFHPKSFRYMVDRNFAIEQTVDAIKRKQVLFFNQKEMEAYMDDFTSMYVEYDFNLNRIKYDHTLPDDCFQAVVYAYLAARQRMGILVPTGVPDI
jgi:hypothetical protein